VPRTTLSAEIAIQTIKTSPERIVRRMPTGLPKKSTSQLTIRLRRLGLGLGLGFAPSPVGFEA
jgi:hypothetical protein